MRWMVLLLAVACAKKSDPQADPKPESTPTSAPAPMPDDVPQPMPGEPMPPPVDAPPMGGTAPMGTPSPAPAGSTTATGTAPMPATGSPGMAADKATAMLESKSGSKVTGTVMFEKKGEEGVKVTIDIAGATPGDHAVHVHEKGDCSSPDGESAGSHFNPAGVEHGNHDSKVHHPGDFGNVTVGADGKGHKELTTKDISLDAGANRVVGLAVIVHEKKDDFSQPTGNAGGRQACGVIK
jgi:superoxide dismutase, Cu-Zn family